MSTHLPDPPHAIIRAASRELDHALDQIEADAVVAAYRERARRRIDARLGLWRGPEPQGPPERVRRLT